MKTFKEFSLDQIEEVTLPLEEESAPATTSTSGVANPDAKPMIRKSKVFGHQCYEVDSDTYHKCQSGKIPFKRWSSYIEDEDLRNVIKRDYHKNKRLLIQDAKSGSMVYIK